MILFCLWGSRSEDEHFYSFNLLLYRSFGNRELRSVFAIPQLKVMRVPVFACIFAQSC